MIQIPDFATFQNEIWLKMTAEEKLNILNLISSYEAFQERYKNDLAGFISNCFIWNKKKNVTPTDYQLNIAESFQKHKRVAVRTLHGAGKTAFAAWTVWWFVLTRDRRKDWKVITTASAWRQLEKYLWPEIHKWHKLIDWKKIGINPLRNGYQLLQLNIKLKTGQASAIASDNHEYIEGAHADSILYIFDESKAISDSVFDAAEGAFSTAGSDTQGEAFILSISTPGEPVGRFYDIHTKRSQYSDWWTGHIKLEDVLRAGRVSLNWVNDRKKQWGEKSAIYQNRVEGQFAQQEEDSLIPLRYIDAAVLRWLNLRDRVTLKPDVIGLDVARFGDDKTIFAFKSGPVIKRLLKLTGKDTMEIAGLAIAYTETNKKVKINVDVIGIGAGVFDRLKEMQRRAVAFNAAGKTDKKDKSKEFGFLNVRSAAWWNLRELLMAEDSKICLPPDDGLIGDLSAPRWKINSSGKIQIESKDDIRKRIGKSTDEGDAVVQAFWEETSPGWVI